MTTHSGRTRRRTVRLRLTLLQGALFLGIGAGLVGVTYLLSASELHNRFTTDGAGASDHTIGDGAGLPDTAVLGGAQTDRAAQHTADLHIFLGQSLIALAIMTLFSIGLAWLVAGRMLRPLRVMTASTRQIFEDNLHRRLALDGPQDELKELGDTIDGLLARLESAFNAQRLFVAHASHELRTPLTFERAMLEVVLADPDVTAQTLRATCEEALTVNHEQERMINALLTLAQSQRGLSRRVLFDLGEVATRVLQTSQLDPALNVQVRSALAAAPVAGDLALAERLVTNLVENAIRYNIPGGTVDVTVRVTGARTVLQITNTGPVLPVDEIDRLFQPFQRLGRERTGHQDARHGLGLGLSIVAAVAASHDATLSARPGDNGGLDISIGFPVAVSSVARRSARPAR